MLPSCPARFLISERSILPGSPATEKPNVRRRAGSWHSSLTSRPRLVSFGASGPDPDPRLELHLSCHLLYLHSARSPMFVALVPPLNSLCGRRPSDRID